MSSKIYTLTDFGKKKVSGPNFLHLFMLPGGGGGGGSVRNY